MAIEVEIPKDISKYESKLIGPLTTRQTVCSVPAVAIDAALVFFLRGTVSMDTLLGFVVFATLPFIVIGWIKIYNMPFEKFAGFYLQTVILAPKHRKYVTENSVLYEDDDNPIKDCPSNLIENKQQTKQTTKTSKTYKAYE